MARFWGRVNGRFLAAAVCAGLACGCASNDVLNRVIRENDSLKREKFVLERDIRQCRLAVGALQQQVANLQSFSEERPIDLFSPTRIEILSHSGVRDLDGSPGYDAVMAYVRLNDADGDAVKAPGRIAVQLLDNSDLSAPRVIGKCDFDRPDELRRSWHGRFLTYHYSLECPFHAQASLPSSGRITISVRFDDYLTGRALSGIREIEIGSATSGE